MENPILRKWQKSIGWPATRPTPSQSYIDAASAMMTVAVFAGGVTFATIFTLSETLDNFNYISDLLSFASLLFATCLFIGVGLHYLLRKYNAEEIPSSDFVSIACLIHSALMASLLVAGFAVLDVILFNVGRKVAGLIGISLLSSIIIWFIVVEHYTYKENNPEQNESRAGFEKEVVMKLRELVELLEKSRPREECTQSEDSKFEGNC